MSAGEKSATAFGPAGVSNFFDKNSIRICNNRTPAREERGVELGANAEEEWAVLMRAAIDGDSGAYRRLFETLTPALRASARRNCARMGLSADEAEDIVQETLLAIHLKRHTWDMGRPIAPWIRTIARHKLIDARRRRGERAPQPVDEFADILAADGAEDAQDRGDLDRLIEKLDERPRDLVRSLSVEGRSVQETAVRLNMSEGAVRVALHRAIKSLAALYRGGEE